MKDWSRNIKLGMDNLWGHRHNKLTSAEKAAWQNLPDAEILKIFESWLPGGESNNNKSDSKLKLFREHLQKHQLIVDFSAPGKGALPYSSQI